MKLILFLSLLFTLSINAFALEMNLGACQTAADEFIIKGDRATVSPGARLWNFKKFSSRFKDHEGSECEKEAFDQALKESKEYWDYIKDRSHCPKEGEKVCDSVEANLKYISGMEIIYDGSAVIPDDQNQKTLTVKNEPNCVQGHTYNNQIRDLHKHVFTVLPYLPTINAPLDNCAHVPAKDRVGSNSNSSQASVIGSAVTGCMIKFVQGIFSNISDLVTGLWDLLEMGYELAKKFGSLIIDFLKAGWYGTTATFVAEQMAQGSDFFSNIAKSFKSIPQAIYKAVSTEVADFKCLNGPAQTAAVCKGVGYVGTEIAFGILTGGIGTEAKLAAKSAKIAKAASKSSELAKIANTEKKFIKGVKVVEAANSANKTKTKIEEFRNMFKKLVHEIDPKFVSPSDYFTGAKEVNHEEALAYMKKLKPDITEADLKPNSRWSKVMGSKLHPDRFAKHNNPELDKMAHKESLNFQGLFELAGSPP
jgi:hypothetical protein